MNGEMAIRGTHDWVMRSLAAGEVPQPPARALDIGAGRGALSARLRAAGWTVSACDVAAEQFRAEGVTCKGIDASGRLPYPDAEFDLAVGVEVLEHVDGHDRFFAEAARVLAPDGTRVFTTPNILSLKSRMRFLLTGFYYSFGPLAPFKRDPIGQHISPFTLNRYAWMLSQHGFRIRAVCTDKRQASSLLLAWLAPFALLASRLQFGANPEARRQNGATVLFGRKLLIVASRSVAGGGQ
jgi:SAM-dependent methyltransferase